MAERTYDIKAYSQDPYGMSKRTEYMESIMRDIETQELIKFAQESLGINLQENPPEKLPDSEEELNLHMQLSYKQEVELAEEQAITTILDGNKFDETRKRLYYDLTTIGIACVKDRFTTAEGIKVEYVDPANIVYSHTESPYFDDLYYVGEVKTIPINELKKEFPNLDEDELMRISNSQIKNQT